MTCVCGNATFLQIWEASGTATSPLEAQRMIALQCLVCREEVTIGDIVNINDDNTVGEIKWPYQGDKND